MPQQIPCQTCGELFTPRTGGKPQVRCSEKCRRKTANANYIKKNAPERTNACAECGGPVAHEELGRPRRFCSDQCKKRASNRSQNRRRLPAPKLPTRSCEHCGRTFAPNRRDQIYCSNAHTYPYCAVAAYQARKKAGEPLRQVEQTRTCVECGKQFTAFKSNAKWCSPICRIRTNGREASRRRGPVQPGWKPYSDREIFERDGWICQICNRPVDPDLPRTHAEGATIDHVIPLALGGSDEPDNVVTAHLRCNLEKSNRVRPEDLAAWVVRHHSDLVAAELVRAQAI